MALLNHEDCCLFLFQLLFIVMNDLIANFVRKYSVCMSSHIPVLVCVCSPVRVFCFGFRQLRVRPLWVQTIVESDHHNKLSLTSFKI